VWLDRFGYDPSELAPLESMLTAHLGPPLVGGLGQRYAYFDLLPLEQLANQSGPQATRSETEKKWLLNPLLMKFGPGFYDEEQTPDRKHRWSRSHSALQLANVGDTSQTAVFRAVLQAGQAGVLRMVVDGRPMDAIPFSATESKPISVALTVPAGASTELVFAFDGPALNAPGDTRTLYFALINPRIDER
jgi:hypothetical protein